MTSNGGSASPPPVPSKENAHGGWPTSPSQQTFWTSRTFSLLRQAQRGT